MNGDILKLGFSHSSVGKESSCNAGDPGSIPGLGRYPRERKGKKKKKKMLENTLIFWPREFHGLYSHWQRVRHD